MIAVLAEANPLDYEKIGDVVAVVRPILDSVLDPTGKDRWRRDAEVTVTIDELVARLTAPAGWEYSRLARRPWSGVGPTSRKSSSRSR